MQYFTKNELSYFKVNYTKDKMHNAFADDERIAQNIFENLRKKNLFTAVQDFLELLWVDV